MVQTRLDSDVPVRWKFAQFLEKNGITVYALAKKLEGKVTITTLYTLKNKPPERVVDYGNVDALLDGLSEMTGREVDVTEIVEYVRP